VIARALPVVLVVCCLATQAGAVLAPDLSQRIVQTAEAGRAEESREAARAAPLGDPALTRMMTTRAREHSRAALDAVVIGAIAENPGQAGEILAAARSAAPGLAPDIARHAAETFPFLAMQNVAAAPLPSVQVGQATAPRAVQDSAPRPARDIGGPPPPTDALPEIAYDPLEGLNRGIFAFNDVFDRFLLRPIAWVYGQVTPEPAKRSVRNFFRNLRSPVRLANDMLQLAPEDAGTTLARFLINTTVGVGGLFEVADGWGLKYKPADFGQTMHSYGVNGGPYLVVPFLGPTTMRDGTGLIVDTFFDPLSWVLDTQWNGAVLGGRVVVTREQLIEPLDKLREGSLDYYAALRSAYYQDRATELRKGVPAPTQELDKEFEQAE